jgi:hypothetical protein
MRRRYAGLIFLPQMGRDCGGDVEADLAVRKVFPEKLRAKGKTASRRHVSELRAKAVVAGCQPFQNLFLLELKHQVLKIAYGFLLQGLGFFFARGFDLAGPCLGRRERDRKENAQNSQSDALHAYRHLSEANGRTLCYVRGGTTAINPGFYNINGNPVFQI